MQRVTMNVTCLAPVAFISSLVCIRKTDGSICLKKTTQALCAIVLPLILSSTSATAQDTATQYKYDARGRLTKVTNGASQEVNYAYDEAGNREAISNQTIQPVSP